MREIEFRVFVKDKEKIFNVKTIDFAYKLLTFEEENKPTDTMRMLDQVELMQYTGLKDKNGTKIFEGDIVSATYDGECERVYQVILFNGGYKMKSKDCSTVYDYSIHDEHPDFEVIGNIYDNPELLENN